MKVYAFWENGLLVFNHFVVKQESERFWGVYRYSQFTKKTYGAVITSGETFKRAARKAKLLEIGYEMCKEEFEKY